MNCRFVQVELVCLSWDVLRLGNDLRWIDVVVIIGNSSWITHRLCRFRCRCVLLWPLLRQLNGASQNFVRLHQCLVAISVLRLRCVQCVLFAERTFVVIILSLLIRFEILQAVSMFLESVPTRVVRLQSLYVSGYVRSSLGLRGQAFKVGERGGIAVVCATVSEVSVYGDCFYLWLVVKVKHIKWLHPLLQLSLRRGYRCHKGALWWYWGAC